MRIGIDTGGTFTDFVVFHDDGTLECFKLRSNHSDPSAVLLEGLRRIGNTKAEVIHGSTVATNALLERRGARTAFVTTAGFEDLLFIGRQNRPALYDLTPPPRRFLVPRELCFGANERVHYDGAIARGLSAKEARRIRTALRRSGAESVAICFLHAYRNDANEQALAAAMEDFEYAYCSSSICPEYREYERASTTVLSAYVGPLIDRYLRSLVRRAANPIWVMQSNGGLLAAETAARHAARMILSGPAGGVAGAFEVARQAGFPKAIGFDMGGTSTDVSLCDGAPRESMEAVVDGIPLRLPMLDIHTVGAGGGSIARIDAGGLLRVGPESAGAAPGPACYGAGELPTVTDAHVVLGRIAERQILGGGMELDGARAQTAVSTLGMDSVRAAEGILRVANSNMQRAIRAISVERGYDPRKFALVAFGGCGGLHACEIASELGIRTVLVPEHAGVLSALGMLLADRTQDFSAGAIGRTGIPAQFDDLEANARTAAPGAKMFRRADMRYAGQSYELTIPWRGDATAGDFHREHQRVYGYCDPNRPVEIVTLRVRATNRTKKPQIKGRPPARSSKPEFRRVFTGGKWRQVPAWLREQLPPRTVKGPALVLDYGSTTLIPEAWAARGGGSGTLVISAA